MVNKRNILAGIRFLLKQTVILNSIICKTMLFCLEKFVLFAIIRVLKRSFFMLKIQTKDKKGSYDYF